MRRASRYAALGAALGVGAPLGLACLRRLLAYGGRRDLDRDLVTYLYLGASTCTVFGAFGWTLGRRVDQLIFSHSELARLREEFASVIAHDLRNPVNALRLQSELLLRQGDGDELRVPRRAMERVDRATGDLARMIDDLLDASRLESSRLELQREPHALAELVAEVVEQQRPALRSHPVELRPRPAPRALVDRIRFTQILANLLDNAAKYSDEGRPIRVSVGPADGGVAVRVEDEGWGIPAEELPRLFDRFYQAKRARAKKVGLGLGLYIVKGLIEAHGGQISVESTVGRGSAFTVWLPAADHSL
jgi:signal transduction histidine kinase